MPLLSLLVTIKKTENCSDILKLRSQILLQIHSFEKKMQSLNYSSRIILAARYCLCTALDEAVLSMSWGANSAWTQQSLLAIAHNETCGGERFYIIIDNMLNNSKNNLEFLELAYLILSLGFEGKYYDNKAKRNEIIANIYREINTHNPTENIDKHLFPETNINLVKNKFRGMRSTLILTLTVLTILFICTAVAREKLNAITDPIIHQANTISTYFLLSNTAEEKNSLNSSDT